jgi:hypothetical protein
MACHVHARVQVVGGIHEVRVLRIFKSQVEAQLAAPPGKQQPAQQQVQGAEQQQQQQQQREGPAGAQGGQQVDPDIQHQQQDGGPQYEEVLKATSRWVAHAHKS